MEEIQAIKEANSEEEAEDEDQTLITPDVGKLLVIWRALHAQEAPCKPSQRDQFFHTRCIIGSKVCELIIDGESSTNAASITFIDKRQLPTRVHPPLFSLMAQAMKWANHF